MSSKINPYTKAASFVETLPPIKKDGKLYIVNISCSNGMFTISHSVWLDIEREPGKSVEPIEEKSVSFDKGQLAWLAPRLEGVRKILGIESGYEKLFGK